MGSILVQPITIGYPFTFTLQFNVTGGSALFLTAPIPTRVRGEFRAAPNPAFYPLLGAVDTQTGSLVINGDGSITMSLTELETSAFSAGNVSLDFARVDAGITSPVGVQFQWPVLAPVTATMT